MTIQAKSIISIMFIVFLIFADAALAQDIDEFVAANEKMIGDTIHKSMENDGKCGTFVFVEGGHSYEIYACEDRCDSDSDCSGTCDECIGGFNRRCVDY